jgi:o-succinylbenzoate---CoA ligase
MAGLTIVRLDEWLTAAARERPDHPALVTAGETLTYGQLRAGAERVARRLAARGVGDGSLVATTLPPGRDFAELAHALPRLGAVLAPLDPRTPTRVDGQLIDAPVRGEEAEVDLRDVVDPGEIHSIVHTSGTTGEPKPVELTYANHLASALASARNLGVESDDRWLCPLPLFHVGGLAVLLRSAIYGTTAVLHDVFDAAAVRDSLESGEATLASLVPTMLSRVRAAGLERAPKLRALLLGGGPIPAGLVEWAESIGLPVVPVYGMTETASQVVAGVPGEPLPGVELGISGEGEILVRGPMVSAAALAADGWLHTGDSGTLDDAGRLTVTGRAKDLIVTGGENVAPAEVEAALLEHPAVSDAAVLGLPDPDWGEAVTAFVVLSDPATAEELIAHARERLAPFKVPKRVEQVAGLPRNPTGKLLRQEISP